MANDAFFHAITRAYHTFYRQTKNEKKTSSLPTETFVQALKDNGITYEECDSDSDSDSDSKIIPLNFIVAPVMLNNTKQEAIVSALYQYCLAGGGPLYDLIKKELESAKAVYETALPSDVQIAIHDNLFKPGIIALLGMFSTFDINALFSEHKTVQSNFFLHHINQIHKLEDSIKLYQLLATPMMLAALKAPGGAVKFMEQLLSCSPDVPVCTYVVIWLYLIKVKILAEEDTIFHLSLMTYISKNDEKFKHIESRQKFSMYLDIMIQSLTIEQLSKVLSLPYGTLSHGTRLQEAAFLLGTHDHVGAKAQLKKMLTSAPNLSIQHEAGRLWIETLLIIDMNTSQFKEIIDLIQQPMLDEFYQIKLHTTLAKELGDPWVIPPNTTEKNEKKCHLILRIIEGKDNHDDNQLRAAVTLSMKDIEKIKAACAEKQDYKINQIINTQRQFMYFHEINPNVAYSRQLKALGDYTHPDADGIEKQLTQVTALITSTVFYLVKLTLVVKYSNLFFEPVFNLYQNDKIIIGQNPDENTICPLYLSIEKSLTLLNEKKSLVNTESKGSVEHFHRLATMLESISDAIFFKNGNENIRLFDIDKMITNDKIKPIIIEAFTRMLIAANDEQTFRLKETKIYKKVENDLGENQIQLVKSILTNFDSFICYAKTVSGSSGEGPKLRTLFSFIKESHHWHSFIIEQISFSIKKLEPIDYSDPQRVRNIHIYLNSFFNNLAPIKITDFDDDIQFTMKKLRFFDYEETTTLTQEQNTFMTEVLRGANDYKDNLKNKFKPGNAETLENAKLIASFSKSSLAKVITHIIYFRILSYTHLIYQKSLYIECFLPALKKLPPMILTEDQQKFILSEIKRALTVHSVIHDDEKLRFLAQDLGLFVNKLGLSSVKLREMLLEIRFFPLSGSSSTSNIALSYYGSLMKLPKTTSVLSQNTTDYTINLNNGV